MSADLAVPEGLEPLGVWDCREPDWGLGRGWGIGLTCAQPLREMREWAMAHIEGVNETYRAEFYLLDGPFAVLYRYERDRCGFLVADDETGYPATASPVVQALDELPLPHLLTRQE